MDNANADIENIQSQQQELQSQIDALDADLVNIIMNLDILEGELSDKQTELDNVTAQLAQAQEDEQNQYDAMKSVSYICMRMGMTVILRHWWAQQISPIY